MDDVLRRTLPHQHVSKSTTNYLTIIQPFFNYANDHQLSFHLSSVYVRSLRPSRSKALGNMHNSSETPNSHGNKNTVFPLSRSRSVVLYFKLKLGGQGNPYFTPFDIHDEKVFTNENIKCDKNERDNDENRTDNYTDEKDNKNQWAPPP